MSILSCEVQVANDGLVLPGGLQRPAHPRGVVVLVHGLPSAKPPEPGDGGYRELAAWFATNGWAAMWADMRAARGAPGWFSIEGWVRDVRAMVEAARSMPSLADGPLVLLGASAGGAASVEAARRGAPIDALVLLAAPAEWLSFGWNAASAVRRITEDAGMALHPDVLRDPSSWIAEYDRVVPERSIEEVDVPTLIVHGAADEVVPVVHARRLHDASRSAELRVLDEAPHQLRRHPPALEAVLGWLDSTLEDGDRPRPGTEPA